MAADTDSTVPVWAANLMASVEGVRQATNQIPQLIKEIEQLQANSVPIGEHAVLMQRVETLWNRDLEGRGDWQNMTQKVPTLWQERAESIGARKAQNRVIAIMGVALTLLTIFTLLRDIVFSHVAFK